MKHTAICILAGALALGTMEASAAKAPLSPEKLKETASHIISGEVLEIASKTHKSEVEKAWGIHRDRVFTFKLKVKAVSKGTGITTNDVVDVEAWQPSRRIPPLPGPQGHGTMPIKGADTVEEVRLDPEGEHRQ
jgi:hypothetical protein